MKLYHVKIVDKKTNEILVDKQERAITKKRLIADYYSKFVLHPNKVTIKLTRLMRKKGVQIDIFKVIEEENG